MTTIAELDAFSASSTAIPSLPEALEALRTALADSDQSYAFVNVTSDSADHIGFMLGAEYSPAVLADVESACLAAGISDLTIEPNVRRA